MMETGYADKGHIMAVEFDRKIIIYWWIMANVGLLVTMVGIILMPIWILFGLLVHKKQYEHMSGALTDRSINMRMGWLFKKQQNIPLDKLTDVSIHEGPILNAFGVVRMRDGRCRAVHPHRGEELQSVPRPRPPAKGRAGFSPTPGRAPGRVEQRPGGNPGYPPANQREHLE